MTVKLNDKFLKSFVSDEEIKAEAAHLPPPMKKSSTVPVKAAIS